MRSAARACSTTSVTMSPLATIRSPACRATVRPSAGTLAPDGGHPSSISFPPVGWHSTFDEDFAPSPPPLRPRRGFVLSEARVRGSIGKKNDYRERPHMNKTVHLSILASAALMLAG